MTTLQPTLLPTPKTFLPMLDRRGVVARIVDACDVLYTEAHLAADLDEGAFAWVFDLSGREEAARKELRFFPGSVEERIRKFYAPSMAAATPSIEDVVRRTLPMTLRQHGHRVVTGRVLRTALNCSPELLNSLIDQGGLKQFGDSQYRRGRGGDPLIEVQSVQALLLARRLNP